jgi:hypothetical protein
VFPDAPVAQGSDKLMDRTGTARTMPFMLSFADGAKASQYVLGQLSSIADRFLDDGRWHEDLVLLLCDVPAVELYDTFRPLTADLFGRFGTSDPDITASDLAEMVRPVICGVWGMQRGERRWQAVDVAGRLIASDFAPDDPAVVAELAELHGGAIMTALAQWTLAMSVTLSYAMDDVADGGDPIRWFGGHSAAPDSDARVIVGGAAS